MHITNIDLRRLTHRGRLTNISNESVNWAAVSSNNGWSPIWNKSIIWINANLNLNKNTYINLNTRKWIWKYRQLSCGYFFLSLNVNLLTMCVIIVLYTTMPPLGTWSMSFAAWCNQATNTCLIENLSNAKYLPLVFHESLFTYILHVYLWRKVHII